jgi:hypothetical protein
MTLEKRVLRPRHIFQKYVTLYLLGVSWIYYVPKACDN